MVRAWLNGLIYYDDYNAPSTENENRGFLQGAFTEAEQARIIPGWHGDKIYLPELSDISNNIFPGMSVTGAESLRQKTNTAFSGITDGSWWLRNKWVSTKNKVYLVNSEGSCNNEGDVTNKYGVVPALRLKL